MTPSANVPPPPPPPRALPEVLAPLQADLDLVGAAFRRILGGVGERSQALVTQGAQFTGKRLRPGLTCVAGRIAGAGVTENVATVAAIVELIHTATLVHDDIIDGADIRRKTVTLNSAWGDQTAVLAGDVLFSKAYHAAAWLDDPYASRYLSEVVGEVLEGEIHQDLVARTAGLPEAEYRRIIRGKTAALYEAALRVGAHYGGASQDLEDALGRYGHHLGMAFQIVDDRLDLTGDEAVVGKTLGTDLAEGKTTLPVIIWQRDLGGAAQVDATALLERAWGDPAAAAQVARELVASGALEAADRAATEEIEAALAHIQDVPEGPQRGLLADLARYVLSRTR